MSTIDCFSEKQRGLCLEYAGLLEESKSNLESLSRVVEQAVRDDTLYTFQEISTALKKIAKEGVLDVSELVSFVHAFESLNVSQIELEVWDSWDPKAKDKLRMMTILSLLTVEREMSFAALMTALRFYSEREVEQLVVRGMQAGAIVGKVDQLRQTVRVFDVYGRDVSQEDLSSFLKSLQSWKREKRDVVERLEDSQQRVSDDLRQRAEKEKQLHNKLKMLSMSQVGAIGDSFIEPLEFGAFPHEHMEILRRKRPRVRSGHGPTRE